MADLVDHEALRQLAAPANIRLGKAIAEAGGVAFTRFGPTEVVARVAGDQSRTVALRSTAGRLEGSCTCTSGTDRLCKHAVAAAIATWETAPKRR